jgi:sulfide:quinone oxidoreductase
MAKIVVMGAGVGGTSLAYELRAELDKSHEIMVISDSPEFQFTPSNPWVAVNWRQREDVVIELEPCFKRKNISFSSAGVKKLDPLNNQIELCDNTVVSYDYLVIATGPRLAFDEIEGLGPVDGYTQSVCHVDHATEAKQNWNSFVEDPGPVVIGAVQGASCFGPAYEFSFIVDADLRKRKIRDKVPMTYVTSEPYIGHMGLNGIGDSKTLLESELRDRHINWICNAKVIKVEDGLMTVAECDETGEEKQRHELPFKYSMLLPAFTGIDAVRDVPDLVNPRGFIIADKHQRNPNYPNIFAVGVCVAIAPDKPTPVPTGVPKTGYMIESMVAATVKNIKAELAGLSPDHEATWNAICLADMGDTGIAFVALPQIPPRNVTWARKGKWVHLAKVAFEKYFMRKVRVGDTDPAIERKILKMMGIEKLKD